MSDAMAFVVCTHNGASRLPRTLSALAEARLACPGVGDIVVVDNASTDDTSRVAADFATRGVRVVREERPGLAYARLCGVRSTHEPWIAFVDDDCVVEPAWASAVLALAGRRPQAAAVGGKVDLEFVRPPGPPTPYHRLLAAQDFGESERALTDPEHGLVGAALALRRDVLEASGWTSTRSMSDRTGAGLSSGGDYEMVFAVRKAGGEVWYTPDARALHVIPPERVTPAYLARLARSIARDEPRLKWLALDRPDGAWVRAHAERARRKYLLTLLLEWRPGRRALRLAERAGRREGWGALLADLTRPT
jgi:glycosyltransferase involved in cell wall biosynthesis